MHHEEFDVKAALHELYGLSLKYYDDVCDDMLCFYFRFRHKVLISHQALDHGPNAVFNIVHVLVIRNR